MNKIVVTDKALASMEDFYGIFFEDINHAADGGLYGEMVRNRAFEFSPIDNPQYQSLTAWKTIEEGGASVTAYVSDKEPLSIKNPNYLVLCIDSGGARAGIKNTGYNSGIAVQKGKKYNFSCYARADKRCRIIVSIDSAEGQVYAAEELCISSGEWTKYSLGLTVQQDDYTAVLAITSDECCKFCLDFVSLFPVNTFKGRENGMRADIAQMLADLKPRFMRFPGGCLVHDGTLNADDRNSMYRWKNTIGDLTKRPSRRSNWRYNQSLGLGFYEYFVFCEDIGAKPLPVLPAGYNPHTGQAVPFDEIQEWIDDALDLIEFAKGDEKTKWGAVRAGLGHREPFCLEYLAVGNEEVGQAFWDRYDLFHKAIREKYPEIKIINSASPFPAGGEYERGWANARKNGSDLIDEHYYASPEWFLANYHRYDNYPENPKVFLGEYASWGNSFYNALIEAAYMTGLENNARSVGMVCYAPLLCNVDYVNWKPDLIWFNNHRVYGSANYYVQKLFMNNTGRELLKIRKTGLERRITYGDEKITGDVCFEADACDFEIHNLTITDFENGTAEKFGDFLLTAERTRDITSIKAGHYKIEFSGKRITGDLGISLDFGKKDSGNQIRWLIGGWENKDTQICALVNGRSTALDQNTFSIAANCEYRFCLEVNGREIVSYINGVVTNHTVDKIPVMEELYFTASRGGNNIYVKCVNVRRDAVTAKLCIDGISEASITIYELTGDENDENSFDNPRKVFPSEREISCKSDNLEYTFKPESITIFAVRGTGED